MLVQSRPVTIGLEGEHGTVLNCAPFKRAAMQQEISRVVPRLVPQDLSLCLPQLSRSWLSGV